MIQQIAYRRCLHTQTYIFRFEPARQSDYAAIVRQIADCAASPHYDMNWTEAVWLIREASKMRMVYKPRREPKA